MRLKLNNYLDSIISTCIMFFFQSLTGYSQVDQRKNLFYEIHKSDDTQLIIEFSVPQFQTNLTNDGKNGYHIISIPGYNQMNEIRKPQLPFKSFLIGIPPNSTPRLEILEADFNTSSNYNIPCTPEIVINQKIPEEIETIQYSVKRITSNMFLNNHFYPEQIASIGNTCTIRDQLISTIQIYPIQYNAGTQTIRYYKTLKLKITFIPKHQKPGPAVNNVVTANPIEKMLKASLINYAVAKNWKVNTVPKLLLPKPSWKFNEHRYKIFVEHEGIYVINKNLLDNAGLNTATIDPMKIRIFNYGTEIPIYIKGEADSTFDDSDYIEFYGTAAQNQYTYTNVYWLTIDETTNGQRMILQDGRVTGNHPVLKKSKTTGHFEKETYYSTSIPNGEGEDHWFWDYIIAPNSLDLTALLNNVVDSAADSCSIKIEYRGFTETDIDPDHHTIVSLNGYQVLNDFWDGKIKYSNEVTIPQNYLTNGANTISIKMPGDTGSNTDIIYINYFEILYWCDNIAQNDSLIFQVESAGQHQIEVTNFSSSDIIVYDITDVSKVKKINNPTIRQAADDSTYTLIFQDSLSTKRRFFATTESRRRIPQIEKDEPSQLKSGHNQADYIIISHEDFRNNLSPLIQYRQNQGLNVISIKITEIYDEFNFGVKNPKAIKDFLEYAYYNWAKPAPTYVLLVGDASYDYKDHLQTGHRDFVPTHLFESKYYYTETASDNWFVCVSGNDNMPDMLIGRLPVQSILEVETIINKIINYENSLPQNNWHKNLLFFADDDDYYTGFEAFSDSLIKYYIPTDYNTEKVFLKHFSDPDSAKNKIINNINQGCLIANYFGHGGIEFLAKEKLLETNDIPNLTNNEKLPFFVSLSCLNGFFHHAKIENCLSETMIKADNRGAIGCYSPSGFAIPGVLLSLADELYSSIFQSEIDILGLITAQSKLGILKAGDPFLDHIDFYNLLGDPALRLKLHPENLTEHASYFGSIKIDDAPAPIGTEITAWIHDINYPANFKVRTPGQFGMMYVCGDNPATPQIEGGSDGDSVKFKIVTITQDSLLAEQTRPWKAGVKQHVDINVITDSTDVTDETKLQILVNNQILGENFFDGDPIFKNSVIQVKIANSHYGIDINRTQVILNGQALDKAQYSILPAENDPFYDFIISYKLNNLPDDFYDITIKVYDLATPSNITTAQFSFKLCSAMTLDRVLNFPNPMQNSTSFTYYLVNHDPAEVKIKIYTVAGRLIKVIDYAPGNIGYNQILWDGKDNDFDELANGVYFYKISARSGNEIVEAIGRLVVIR
ncbi:MAG: C25 family cysteine peptidase [bacterium]